MLEIPVFMPEQTTDLTSVRAEATALKKTAVCCTQEGSSSGFWELVLSLEQDAHLPQCQAVIPLPSGSWWGKERAQRHNLTRHFPASAPKYLPSFFKSCGPDGFIQLKLPSTSCSVISFLCATFLST